AVVSAPWALIALQALHGMTFGMFWSAAIALVASTVPPSLRATGQALLIMAINLGAAVGNTITGRVYDAYGSRLPSLLGAGGAAGAGAGRGRAGPRRARPAPRAQAAPRRAAQAAPRRAAQAAPRRAAQAAAARTSCPSRRARPRAAT